ncbi:SMP-30/gluconolactonase/LRE family protein [Streptacidiphilus pinicola]|uniref:SMP-30/gluconolactonase/LRE family protein n=1 Tax=Streptacidiphilus pinicola TaxID=2219663 RepID=A0A2X0IU92_9ACTN|nr:SMP-30/gluconolactonase/LRE family protein [Streptacidiphilus pinicola]RAG87203.1 SMP-30/gluconolactonase/LRE family protein [Streptacidiphilus pinicola]
MTQPTTPQKPASPWTDRLELGEGARWIDDRLVLVDLLRGRLLAPNPTDPAMEVLAELGTPLGAVAPIHANPNALIAAAGTGVCILTGIGTDELDVAWIARTTTGPTENGSDTFETAAMRVNDCTADSAGRFWFGTMAYDAAEDAGSLYRVDRDGTLTRVLDRISIPNGPAFTEDGTTMYLADSARRLVQRYSVDVGTGALGEPEVFADFADCGGGPDGMTVDLEGGVWIACWGAGAVHRYLPDGTLDRMVELPAAQPASVCLGGSDGRLLHITTAHYGIECPGEADGAVFTLRVDVPGFPAASFRNKVER